MKLVCSLNLLLVFCFVKIDYVFGVRSVSDSFQDEKILDDTQELISQDWNKMFKLIIRMSNEVVIVSKTLVTYNADLDLSAKKMKEFKDAREKLRDDIYQKNASFYKCLGAHCERKRETKGSRTKTDAGRLWQTLKTTINLLSEQLIQVNKAVTALDPEMAKLLAGSAKEEYYSYTTLKQPHFCCEV